MTPSRARASRTVRWSGKTATGLLALAWLGSSRSRRRWLRAKIDPLAHAQPRPKGARYGAGRARALEPGVGHRPWRGYGSIDAQCTALANVIVDGGTVLWYHRVGRLEICLSAPQSGFGLQFIETSNNKHLGLEPLGGSRGMSASSS